MNNPNPPPDGPPPVVQVHRSTPINATKLDVIYAMIDYGGGFVRRLGEAWLLADTDSQARLRAAFPHYWEQYTTVAQQRLERNAAARVKAGAA